MSRESLLILLGFLIAFLPFAGLPYAFLMVLLPIFGAIVVIIAITLRLRRKRFVPPETPSTSYAPETEKS